MGDVRVSDDAAAGQYLIPKQSVKLLPLFRFFGSYIVEGLIYLYV